MLVYANSFQLTPKEGVDAVIKQVAIWVGKARSSFVDEKRLAEGIRDLKLPEGASLSSLATIDAEGAKTFPYYFSATYTHGQPEVPGR